MKAIAIIATAGTLLLAAMAAGDWMGNLSDKHHSRIEHVAAGGRG